MTKTINAYTPSAGEVEITFSAANNTAITEIATTESIILDGAVRSFKRTNNPELPVAETRVTGDTEPIIITGNSVPRETWELVLVDDYYSGAAGEWGTDDLAAVEIFELMFKARQHPGAFKCTPAGGGAANMEITLVDCKIVAVGVPDIDADAETSVAEVTVMLTSSGHTLAAHG